MSFPESYRWPSEATRTQSIIGLGNAVCPRHVKELIRELAA